MWRRTSDAPQKSSRWAELRDARPVRRQQAAADRCVGQEWPYPIPMATGDEGMSGRMESLDAMWISSVGRSVR